MTTMLYIAGRIVDDKDKKAIRWQLLGVFETTGGVITPSNTRRVILVN